MVEDKTSSNIETENKKSTIYDKVTISVKTLDRFIIGATIVVVVLIILGLLI